jgi:hypothetical protein
MNREAIELLIYLGLGAGGITVLILLCVLDLKYRIRRLDVRALEIELELESRRAANVQPVPQDEAAPQLPSRPGDPGVE